MTKSRLSILSNASSLDVRQKPYPHLVIKNALDPDIYAQLEAEYPDPALVLNGREKKDTWYDYPACLAMENDAITPKWKEFLDHHTSEDFYHELVELFGDAITDLYPNLETRYNKELDKFSTSIRQPDAASNEENYEADVSLECQFYINYTEQARAVRGPHIDRPTELYAALLYFRQDDDDSQGSNLAICEAEDDSNIYPSDRQIKVDHLPMELNQDKVTVSNVAEYEANTLVLFINSKKSIHAVTPRTATPVPRKHINFTADLFALKNDALFEVVHNPSKKLKKWLEEQPVIWRFAKMIKD